MSDHLLRILFILHSRTSSSSPDPDASLAFPIFSPRLDLKAIFLPLTSTPTLTNTNQSPKPAQVLFRTVPVPVLTIPVGISCNLLQPRSNQPSSFHIFSVHAFLSLAIANPLTAAPVLPTLPQVSRKESREECVARSYWDVLRRGASQALFSDLAEVQLQPSLLSFIVLTVSPSFPTWSRSDAPDQTP